MVIVPVDARHAVEEIEHALIVQDAGMGIHAVGLVDVCRFLGDGAARHITVVDQEDCAPNRGRKDGKEGKKLDLRVQKTRSALTSALYDLLCQKSFDDITVTELCERR